jgi:hypothetical protein
MKRRRNARKPALALWMLVAVADVAVLAVAAGPFLFVVALASLVAVVAGVRGLRLLQRRGGLPMLVAPVRNAPRLVAPVRNAPRTEVMRRRW